MVSIIVPVYKVEKFLPKCIESVLNQTYTDFELILVDDGSPDKSPEICDKYAELDKRVVVIHQKNAGVSAARNAGLENAKGEYIGFVDPDDWIAPKMYEQMIFAMEGSNADLAICGYDYYDEDYHVDEQRRYKVRSNEVVDQREIMNRFSDMPPSIRHGVCNKLFKNNLLHTQRFINGLHSSEDVYFLNEYVQKIQSTVIVHHPYYKNLVRQGSATHGGLSIQSLAESFVAHEQILAGGGDAGDLDVPAATAAALDGVALLRREAGGEHVVDLAGHAADLLGKIVALDLGGAVGLLHQL